MDGKTLVGKFWQIQIDSPNLPMFSTANVSRYTVSKISAELEPLLLY